MVDWGFVKGEVSLDEIEVRQDWVDQLAFILVKKALIPSYDTKIEFKFKGNNYERLSYCKW